LKEEPVHSAEEVIEVKTVGTSLYDDLAAIRRYLPELAELLRLDVGPEMTSWCKIVDTRMLTRFDPKFPLVAAICGGGSSGKSTLFNSLAAGGFAPTGGRAGMNRRILFSVPEQMVETAGFIASLVEPSGRAPQPLRQPEDLLQPGPPLYVTTRSQPVNLVLMDTPDFDTGARGAYANRESAQGALEAADILIYIFTNANYNNRDNTDFIARMLTGIGRRKCFLVYRVYPSFTSEEVTEHAMTVARNIYGADADHYVLGIFRADEDNRIAAGERSMTVRPVSPGEPAFAEALNAIDLQQLRRDLYASVVAGVLREAGSALDGARVSLAELGRYSTALRAAQTLCLQEALRYFPMDRVMRRFAKIWARSDPPAVKLMRRTGSLIEFPLKALVGTAGWAREKLAGVPAPPKPGEQFVRRLEENLVTAVTTLHQQALSPYLTHSGSVPLSPGGETSQGEVAPPAKDGAFAVKAHPVVRPAQERLRQREFAAILQSVMARKEDIGEIGRALELELRALADHFRGRMGLWDKIGQTFWAFLNVLPAAAAVTYVLSTGDPVGGAAVKVKLTGLFGMKDLYALVAIPVTRGMKQADRKQLRAMLGPIARVWLELKSQSVQELFEREISGDILHTADEVCAEGRRRVAELHELLARARGETR
jgi:hypothetical protein